MARTPNDELFRSPRKNRIVILEELNFIWDEPELKEMSKMWESEIAVQHIAERFNRDADEVLLALIHLARAKRISSRACGLGGKEE